MLKKGKFRKPDNYMIKSLKNNFFIDYKNSFMIGNTAADKQCAIKSQLRYVDIKEIL